MKRNETRWIYPFVIMCIFILLTSNCAKKEDSPGSPPVVKTVEISNISPATATCGGNITSQGTSGISARGVCWNTSANPSISDAHTNDGYGTGIFTSNITGLTANTTYYVRAYATNSSGTGYGDQVNFTTPSFPELTTAAVTDITSTSVTCGGNITSQGSSAIMIRGVCWSTSVNPSFSDAHTNDGSGTGIFTSNITGLASNTPYYVRAYAGNSTGIGYGNQVTFTTNLNAFPELTTDTIINITPISAVSGGNITSPGTSAVTARGVCWSLSTNPLVTDAHTTDGSGSGSFTSNINGLLPNTPYFVRAYATNNSGTSYGNELTFTSGEFAHDIDGNNYNTVKIHGQVWMVENLKTTRYNDGSSIPLVTDQGTWMDLYSPGYCWYQNNPGTYKNTYGAIYNWFAVNTGKLAPTGWHVPSNDEWTTLAFYLGLYNDYVSGKLKEKGTVHWRDPNAGATNETGFTALPGGDRDVIGEFIELHEYGYWWTSTSFGASNSWYRRMYFDDTELLHDYCSNTYGFSVRCIKD